MTPNDCANPTRECPVTNELLMQIGRIEQRQEDQRQRQIEQGNKIDRLFQRLDTQQDAVVQAAVKAATEAQPAPSGHGTAATIGGTIGAMIAGAIMGFVQWWTSGGK